MFGRSPNIAFIKVCNQFTSEASKLLQGNFAKNCLLSDLACSQILSRKKSEREGAAEGGLPSGSAAFGAALALGCEVPKRGRASLRGLRIFGRDSFSGTFSHNSSQNVKIILAVDHTLFVDICAANILF